MKPQYRSAASCTPPAYQESSLQAGHGTSNCLVHGTTPNQLSNIGQGSTGLVNRISSIAPLYLVLTVISIYVTKASY